MGKRKGVLEKLVAFMCKLKNGRKASPSSSAEKQCLASRCSTPRLGVDPHPGAASSSAPRPSPRFAKNQLAGAGNRRRAVSPCAAPRPLRRRASSPAPDAVPLTGGAAAPAVRPRVAPRRPRAPPPDTRGDAFLEPYLQGLGPDLSHHQQQQQQRNVNALDASGKTPEDGSVASSPPPPPAALAELSAPFRLLELDGSADSLDQDAESSLSSGTSSDADESADGDAPCDIGLVERLIRTHPVWFLPGIQRAGAFHLLQGKEEGNFVVRQSSQPDTMAISVRLPAGKGPYIEHYLIQAVDGQLSLESSDNRFDNIPQLIAHYSQCCDELPVQLTLPRAMREAKNRQQLSSLALLGQEFWRYPMANPRPPDRVRNGPEVPTLQNRSVVEGQQSPPSSGSSLSSLGSGNNNQHSSSGTNTGKRTPTSEPGADAIVLNLSPLYPPEPSQPPSLMSTFKGSDTLGGSPSPATVSSATMVVTSSSVVTSVCTTAVSARAPRPTPPNTLNLICSASSLASSVTSDLKSPSSGTQSQLTSPPSSSQDGSRAGPLVVSSAGKTPPPPPPRWAKPTSLSTVGGQNFTVTTTVTFSVNNTTPPPHVEVSCIQVAPKRPLIEDGQQTMSSVGSTLDQRSARLQQVVSPSTPSENAKPNLGNRGKKHRSSHGQQSSVKESHHYQESDILESPTVYYRSSVADKVSDYEDIWGPEMLSTFKSPTGNHLPRSSPFSSPEDVSFGSGGRRPPDLLERVGTPMSSSCLSLNSSGNPREQQRNRLGLVINTSVCNSSTNSPMSPPSEGKTQQPEEAAPKQGSPFYAEPADALKQSLCIPRRRPRTMQQAFPHQPRNHRHSDPASFQQWPVTASYHAGCVLERIDSTEELPLSSSVDNLALIKNSRNIAKVQQGANRPRGKPVQPPRVKPNHVGGKSFSDTSWAVDSSWEFIDEGADDDGLAVEGGEEREHRFPSLEQQETSLEEGEENGVGSHGLTVQELIAQRFPDLCLSPDASFSVTSPGGVTSHLDGSFATCSRMSSYDNVEGRHAQDQGGRSRLCGSHASDDDAQTVFSEPWDSSRWETLLRGDDTSGSSVVRVSGARPVLGPEEDDTVCESSPRTQGRSSGAGTHVTRNKSFKERLDPLLSPPRLQALRSRELSGTGASIRVYALHLFADKSTTFAQNIENFIACTCESKETNPQVVMRNMRQFMSGMKNYLVKHGEREFEKEVEKERVKLKATEFLNLDSILEGVMHKLVVRPLKEHLYRLFVDEYTRSGAIHLLADNIRYARTRSPQDLGIRPLIIPPSGNALNNIIHILNRLQEVDSPLEKLEHLLSCISAIFNSVNVCNQGRGCVTLGADDFLPLFVWVLVQSGMVAAEIEAEYMWGLLQSSLLSGEGGYYLTTLSGAVHVLKNFRACSEEQHGALGPDCRVGSLADFRSVLKIVVPDEVHGSIITKTLPVRPNMTTRDVCKIIAHKVRITNPQDYGLFKLVDGEETLLNDSECPQDVKGVVAEGGKHCMFAYKRIDAKIAWPTTSSC
ncbi:protein sprint isoform X2 [Bacillus rossius redtenbacheri]|uniref:protein sprint isoform X2 n=1 Tax=Bacillus rossius redtenbacheri TaxID=93214 RepID=UPI002FDC8343